VKFTFRRWANAEQPVTVYLVAQTMKDLPSQDGNHCHQRYQQKTSNDLSL
jgi:hypothetical protein